MLYMMYYSSPFVAYVHVKLPLFARRSREQLLRWSQNIPPNTELEMTTIKSYGGLRTSRMPVANLSPTKSRFGIQNLALIPKVSSGGKRPWWAPKEQRVFFVGSERKKTVESIMWQKIRTQIEKSRNKYTDVTPKRTG